MPVWRRWLLAALGSVTEARAQRRAGRGRWRWKFPQTDNRGRNRRKNRSDCDQEDVEQSQAQADLRGVQFPDFRETSPRPSGRNPRQSGMGLITSNLLSKLAFSSPPVLFFFKVTLAVYDVHGCWVARRWFRNHRNLTQLGSRQHFLSSCH